MVTTAACAKTATSGGPLRCAGRIRALKMSHRWGIFKSLANLIGYGGNHTRLNHAPSAVEKRHGVPKRNFASSHSTKPIRITSPKRRIVVPMERARLGAGTVTSVPSASNTSSSVLVTSAPGSVDSVIRIEISVCVSRNPPRTNCQTIRAKSLYRHALPCCPESD